MSLSIKEIKNLVHQYRKTGQYSKADRLKHLLKERIKFLKYGTK